METALWVLVAIGMLNLILAGLRNAILTKIIKELQKGTTPRS